MEGLVVYYSRTGNTKKIGRSVAEVLDFETMEIVDKKDRSGFLGYMKGGWDGWRKNRTKIERQKERDLTGYDIIIVGTPVWAANPAPAITTYLDEKKDEIKKTAFFCTCGGSGYKSTFEQLKKISGMEPVDTLVVKEKMVKNEDYQSDVKKFAEKCG